MHVVATFASWIQSLNSNLDVATGNSHLGVRGTKEPAAQQRQRGVGFCLWGLGEKKGSKYGWFNHQIRVPHFRSHVNAYIMLMYTYNYGHLHRKFQLRLYSASIYTISMMNVKKEWHTSSYCLYQCYHAVGSIDITLLQAYVELSKISRFLVCPKCSNVFQRFYRTSISDKSEKQSKLHPAWTNMLFFFCFECTELSKKRTTPKTQNPI